MNGVHDMGGMHGLGPIEHEANEPVFHHRWEARAMALTLAAGAWGKWNIDASRHSRERIPGPEYLRMSYYEKWIAGLIMLMVEAGLVTREEVESANPARGSEKAVPRLSAAQVPATLAKGSPYRRSAATAPRFIAGQSVRTRNAHPEGHTRLPRYARDKAGEIVRDHGVFVFADTNAHFLGEKPQHLYSLRFAARTLWGDSAPARDAVYLDLWDDHLDPA